MTMPHLELEVVYCAAAERAWIQSQQRPAPPIPRRIMAPPATIGDALVRELQSSGVWWTIRDMAAHLEVTPQATHHAMKKLARRGLVERFRRAPGKRSAPQQYRWVRTQES